MLNTKFSPWPVFEPDEIAAATKPLTSGRVNYWTGQECSTFGVGPKQPPKIMINSSRITPF
jgi:hypothetical protein